MSSVLNKTQLREAAKAARASISATDRLDWDAKCCRRVQTLLADLKKALGKPQLRVASYKQFRTEVNLAELESSTSDSYFFPRLDNDQMNFYSGDDFSTGSFGIFEPSGDSEPESDLDVVLVPGLVFDQKGQRLGYGQGHYDRWFVAKSATRVGIAYGRQICAEIDGVEPHDVPMDFVITENYTLRPLIGGSTNKKVS